MYVAARKPNNTISRSEQDQMAEASPVFLYRHQQTTRKKIAGLIGQAAGRSRTPVEDISEQATSAVYSTNIIPSVLWQPIIMERWARVGAPAVFCFILSFVFPLSLSRKAGGGETSPDPDGSSNASLQCEARAPPVYTRRPLATAKRLKPASRHVDAVGTRRGIQDGEHTNGSCASQTNPPI